ncbi:MAG TPA: SDR family oxidoreductase [Chthoniobacterales bacterium]|nr:SDR family oxidoreductase [Chthoniobacterales bacterium]
MILVVGATGMLGGEICRRLAATGKFVRALVRSTSEPAKKQGLERLGAELIEGDLKDRGSLDRACRGATAVITTAVAIGSKRGGDTFEAVDLKGQMQLVDAARAANVERFIFVSVSKGVRESGNPLVEAKRAVEKHLRESGLVYTILRPTFFMEIWLSPHVGFDVQNAKATIYGSGKNPISFISLHDVAQFTVDALTQPAACNTSVELGGPEALSALELVSIFEPLVGRPFAKQFVSEQELQARKTVARSPVELTFADLMLAAARGDVVDITEAARNFSFHPKSVREYARALLGQET